MSAETNRTIEFLYTSEGRLAILIVRNSVTRDQVTRWHYGTTLAESGVASNSLVRAKVYGDSDDPAPGFNGPDTVYDRVEYRYNRLGQLIEEKDKNGTVHAYDYDRLGRLVHDRVTARRPDTEVCTRVGTLKPKKYWVIATPPIVVYSTCL